MPDFLIQPGVHAAAAGYKELRELLDEVWSEATVGSRAVLVSAFVDLNGVLPFVKILRKIVTDGGSIHCYFGGSSSQRMTSRQAVKELLTLGASVRLLNRKKIMHVKLFGVHGDQGDTIVITSGNLTGNGMALNVEAAAVLNPGDCIAAQLRLVDVETSLAGAFDWHELTSNELGNDQHPAWKLTFDETKREARAGEAWVEDDDVLAMTLSATDVARITGAQPAGTQYFWLSRYLAGFFPPLTELPTSPTAIRTFKTYVMVEFIDVGKIHRCSVTFEAYNNLDFRLLTSPLKRTNQADEGDMFLLRRVDEDTYRLKIVRQGTRDYARINPYLVHFVGHVGKRYGMVPRTLVSNLV